MLYHQNSDEGVLQSTRSTSQISSIAEDAHTIKKVIGVVERFLAKSIAMHMDSATLRNHAYKISVYIAQVISNYESENGDEIARCVTENLKGLLPKKALRYIQARDLSQLFNEVLIMFSGDDDDFTVEELLESIVVELENKVPRGISNYSDAFISEYLEDVFAILPLEEVKKTERVKQLAVALDKVDGVEAARIDVSIVVAEITAYFGNSLGHNMDEITLRNFVSRVVKELSKS